MSGKRLDRGQRKSITALRKANKRPVTASGATIEGYVHNETSKNIRSLKFAK